MIEFWEWLPANERIITNVLQQIIIETLPKVCKEKLTYNVPFYYGKKRNCFNEPWFA